MEINIHMVQACLVFILLWISKVKGDIRCYCNEPSCVSTGYMCKSSLGVCYSQIAHDGTKNNGAHGCIDLLKPEERSRCDGANDLIRARTRPHDWPVTLCCKDDMCNYMENVDINIRLESTIKDSIYKGQRKSVDYIRENGAYEKKLSDRDIWFKAAVIAVPIAGGFILILLVLLAVRMLKNDGHHNHEQFSQLQNHHRSLAKAQLYVAGHFNRGKEKNFLKSNFSEKQKKNYKDVSIKIENGHNYEKLPHHKFPNCLSSTSKDSVLTFVAEKPKDTNIV